MSEPSRKHRPPARPPRRARPGRRISIGSVLLAVGLFLLLGLAPAVMRPAAAPPQPAPAPVGVDVRPSPDAYPEPPLSPEAAPSDVPRQHRSGDAGPPPQVSAPATPPPASAPAPADASGSSDGGAALLTAIAGLITAIGGLITAVSGMIMALRKRSGSAAGQASQPTAAPSVPV